jgi:hypothetical protein
LVRSPQGPDDESCKRLLPLRRGAVGSVSQANPNLDQSHEPGQEQHEWLGFLPSLQGGLQRAYQYALLERFGQKRHCATIERT